MEAALLPSLLVLPHYHYYYVVARRGSCPREARRRPPTACAARGRAGRSNGRTRGGARRPGIVEHGRSKYRRRKIGVAVVSTAVRGLTIGNYY